jgi:DNA-binding beta-propeller fold protein YncE
MTKRSRVIATALAGLLGIVGVSVAASVAGADRSKKAAGVDGTIWVANRGAHTIQGFDARTGAVVRTVSMAPSSQPGDLAFARGKLYVAEEYPPPTIVSGAQPAIAIVDPESGDVVDRIPIGPAQSSTTPSWRPHHVHASRDGKHVAFGLYGTDMVAVVETRTDRLLGAWDTNPATTSGRAHAGVFSPNGRKLYVASDTTGEVIALDPRTGAIFWRMAVPGAHELAVMRNGRTAIVARRVPNKVAAIDLVNRTFTDVLDLTLPDTLRFSRNDKLLTIGLRSMPAQVAVVDTRTFEHELVSIGRVPLVSGTTAGHQWTSPNGRYTYAAFEGPDAGVAVLDHRAGNNVVKWFDYPNRPHGVDLEPTPDEDDGDEDD